MMLKKKKRDYDIFIKRDCIAEEDGCEDVESIRYKIRQLILYRIKNTDRWILKKQGAIGNNVKKLLKMKNNTEKPKPKIFNYNIYGYHLGEPYKTDDDGRILGKWSTLGTINIQTDKVEFATSETIGTYKLFHIPIPL